MDILAWLDDWFKQKIVTGGHRRFTPLSFQEEILDDFPVLDLVNEYAKNYRPELLPISEDAIDKDLARKLIAENMSLIGEFSDLLINEKQLVLLVQAQYSAVIGQQSLPPPPTKWDVFSFKCHRVGEHRTQVQITCEVPETVWMLDDLWQDIKTAFEVIKDVSVSDPEPESQGSIQADEVSYQKRGPQLQTLHKLEELRKIREDAIRNTHPIPKKEAAMDQVSITDKTWALHAPNLWSRWDDKTYRPEKTE
jgi:hypothetical protein